MILALHGGSGTKSMDPGDEGVFPVSPRMPIDEWDEPFASPADGGGEAPRADGTFLGFMLALSETLQDPTEAAKVPRKGTSEAPKWTEIIPVAVASRSEIPATVNPDPSAYIGPEVAVLGSQVQELQREMDDLRKAFESRNASALKTQR
jgi:hypothetical protein